MTLYRIQHPGAPDVYVNAAAVLVHDGSLHAMRYGGPYEAGKSETVASWAPGSWSLFEEAAHCPKCNQQVRTW